ncbi:MAG: nucleotidyltransferase domain-containing protein [Nitrososphaerales archaeon]|nr:nucleotidyltransferase domain-containing protein [Nitrososphaerales archaeon]
MLKKLEFITPTFMVVFELFLANPMQEYHEREVIRKTEVSTGSANKILRLLADLDFLIRERKGRMIFYRLNTKDPAVQQFKIFVNVYTLRQLLDQVKEYCRKIILFGSAAQGTDVKESDLDLLILTSGKDSVRRKISEFNRKNERKIAPIIVDANELVKLKREDKPLYGNIERGIVLWETG